jgi:DNA-binding transcriptional ArsR family regulator
MNNIKFYNEPSFVFDLITLFVYKYDKKNVVNKLNVNNADNFENVIDSIIKDSIFPKELLPFFYSKENDVNQDNMSFATQTFLYDLFNMDIEKYSFNNVIKAIDEVDIFRKMVKFYTNDDVIDIDLSPKEFYKILDKINVSDSIKLYMIYFNDNKKQYVELFKNQLIEKSELLKEYYQKNENIINEVKKQTEDEVLLNKIRELNNIVIDDQSKLCFSISPLYELALWQPKTNVIILGYDLFNKIDEINTEIIKLDFINIGRVISERTRLDLLNLLKKEGEKSTSDLANLHKVALPTMFYHLNMMYMAKMVTTRNEGRKVYYRLNNEFFSQFSEKMKNYVISADENL